MVSKIAYEWFCKIKKINEKKEDFLDIIDYITTGTHCYINIVRHFFPTRPYTVLRAGR